MPRAPVQLTLLACGVVMASRFRSSIPGAWCAGGKLSPEEEVRYTWGPPPPGLQLLGQHSTSRSLGSLCLVNWRTTASWTAALRHTQCPASCRPGIDRPLTFTQLDTLKNTEVRYNILGIYSIQYSSLMNYTSSSSGFPRIHKTFIKFVCYR